MSFLRVMGIIQKILGSAALIAALGCSIPTPPEEETIPPLTANIDLLEYNVAGLPQGVSRSDPILNIPIMSPLLNNYRYVFVQEDFAYHNELVADADHEFQTEQESSHYYLNSGLNRLSTLPFYDHERVVWEHCSGIFSRASDCLSPRKGFSYARHELAPGVNVHIYNVHMDAGGSAGDFDARDEQFEQLMAYISNRSEGEAILLVGDFNIHPETRVQDQTLHDRITDAGFVDACDRRICGLYDKVDRVFTRSSDYLFLTPEFIVEDARFVDAVGLPLSDHAAYYVGVTAEFVGSPPADWL